MYCKDCGVKLETTHEWADNYPFFVRALKQNYKGEWKPTGFFGKVWQCRLCFRKERIKVVKEGEVEGKGLELSTV